MKLIPILTTAILASSILTAQAAPKGEQELSPINNQSSQSEIDSKKEVAYTCQIERGGKKQSIKATAMYGIKGSDIIVAQVKINGVITPGMWRDTSFTLMNRFISSDPAERETVWTTMPADAANLAKVDGGKLSVAEQTGAQQSIVLDDCKLDASATARLKH